MAPPKYSNSDRTIRSVLHDVREGSILLNPPWQRNIVWTEKQKVAFMESVFRELPINPIVLWDRINGGVLVCVDGKNRIAAIEDFCNGRFSVGNMRYGTMAPEKKRALEGYKLNFRILQGRWWTEGVIQDYFCSIQGGSQLTPSEKRNATKGRFTALIRELSESPDVRRAFVGVLGEGVLERKKDHDILANIVSRTETMEDYTRNLARDNEMLLAGDGKQLNEYYAKLNEIGEVRRLPSAKELEPFVLEVIAAVKKIGDAVPGAWKLKLSSPKRKPSLREFMVVASVCAGGFFDEEDAIRAFRIIDDPARQSTPWVKVYRSVMKKQGAYTWKVLEAKREALECLAME